jgi:DNA-binding NarL/FixJ family response regulator
MAEGHEMRGVAKSLGISVHTCRGYVKTIVSKLGSHSQSEAVAVAGLRGILSEKPDVEVL